MKKETNKENARELELMIKSIKLNNIGIDETILEAFHVVDRRFFFKGKSIYDDMPQHVAHGQTISQPSTVARMIRVLEIEKDMDVLEVGTNTGYHASLVSWLVWPGTVTTIEIFSDLAEMARKNVKALIKHLEKTKKSEAKRFSQIRILAGDALDKKTGAWQGKYDKIYFTAGVEPDKIKDVKWMGVKLLKDKGFLLYPTRESFDWGALEIWQLREKKLKLVKRETGYAFVPLLRKQELKELYKK